MDYQTYRPITKPSKPRKTFTIRNFAEQTYKYADSSKTNHPPRRNINHVRSKYWNAPITSTNSVSFQKIHTIHRITVIVTYFFNKIKRQQTPYYTNYLSSDDDGYYQPDIFAPYTLEYRTQRRRQPQSSQNKKISP